jgi:hypothetical protein
MQPTTEAHEQTNRDESMGTAGTDGGGGGTQPLQSAAGGQTVHIIEWSIRYGMGYTSSEIYPSRCIVIERLLPNTGFSDNSNARSRKACRECAEERFRYSKFAFIRDGADAGRQQRIPSQAAAGGQVVQSGGPGFNSTPTRRGAGGESSSRQRAFFDVG